MGNETTPVHYVCTHEEARTLVRDAAAFWVSNCGCRERKGGCARSRLDVCLMFEDMEATGSGKRPLSRAEAEKLQAGAEADGLVARPFRNAGGGTAGICFCCDDCCSYFLDRHEVCDKGAMISSTDPDVCTHCGNCVPACRFGARTIEDDRLVFDADACYGCGLCVEECPLECIEMQPR